MKPVGVKIDSFHFVCRDLAAGRVFTAIQPAGHRQAFRRRRLRNKLDDRFVIPQRFAPPVRRDKRKETVFDLVPFTGPWGKVRHRKGQTDLVRKRLQLELPQAETPAVAAASVCGDQDLGGVRINPSPFTAPPAADRGHRERARVVIRPDVDKPGVAPDVVNAIGIGPRYQSCP